MAHQNGHNYDRGTRVRDSSQERLANGLGWFSVGLGIAEVAAPGTMARLIGVRDTGGKRALLRAYGVRELAAGLGILSQPRTAGWIWSRVAGDAVDLASLGSALASDRSEKGKVAFATAAVLGVTALDVYCGAQLTAAAEDATQDHRIRARKRITINRPPGDVYRFWRDLGNVPKFMTRIESVQTAGNTRSHWKANAPGGMMLEWDAEIVDDEPDALIAWRSVEGSGIHNSGTVRFQRGPAGRGTLVTVELQYAPPGGAISARIAKLFGAEPGQQLEGDLRRLKQILETGEIVKSDASIHSGMHAAQPAAARGSQDAAADWRQGAEEFRPSFV